MTYYQQRKLSALALSALFGTGQPAILTFIHDIFTIITSTLIETNDVYQFEEDDDESTYLFMKLLYLKNNDLCNTGVEEFFKSCLQRCESCLGKLQMDILYTHVDQEIMKQISRL